MTEISVKQDAASFMFGRSYLNTPVPSQQKPSISHVQVIVRQEYQTRMIAKLSQERLYLLNILPLPILLPQLIFSLSYIFRHQIYRILHALMKYLSFKSNYCFSDYRFHFQIPLISMPILSSDHVQLQHATLHCAAKYIDPHSPVAQPAPKYQPNQQRRELFVQQT